jgi:hypothetical protein
MRQINVREFGTKPEVGIFGHPSKKGEVIAGGNCPETKWKQK